MSKARTDDLVVSAAEFETQGKGWFAFDHTVDFRALLLLSQQLSQDIISRAKETKNLANDQGRLEVPFNLSGKLPGAKPKPDVGYIAGLMGREPLSAVWKRLFQKKSPKGGAETSPPQGQQPSESQEKKKKVRKTRSFANSKTLREVKPSAVLSRLFRNPRFRLGFSGNQRVVLAGSD